MSRQFTEAEAQRIFARMAEMQRADAARTPGALSREDLEEAAAAAGLDPRYVARAVAELDAAPARTRTLLSAPVEVVRQRVVPGPLTDDTWAAMVEALRQHTGQQGMAGQIGRLREWTGIRHGTKNGIVTRLSAEPTEGGVRLMVTESVREIVKGLSIGAVITALVGLFVLGEATLGASPDALVGVALMALMVVGFTLGAQGWSRWWARERTEQFDALLDRLELVARHAQPDAPDLADGDRQPLLDLDAGAEAPDEAEPRGTRERIRS